MHTFNGVSANSIPDMYLFLLGQVAHGGCFCSSLGNCLRSKKPLCFSISLDARYNKEKCSKRRYSLKKHKLHKGKQWGNAVSFSRDCEINEFSFTLEQFRMKPLLLLNLIRSFLDKALSIYNWANYIKVEAKLTRKPSDNGVLFCG